MSSILFRYTVLARHIIPSTARRSYSLTTAASSATTTTTSMSHTATLGKLSPDSTLLLVCDVQERFRPIINNFPAVVDTSRRMVRAAHALQLPIIVTEQYPKALGSTVTELTEVLPENTLTVPKTDFSMIVPDVEQKLTQLPNIRKVLLVGIETHVCVLQTTLDLIERGYEVHILVDGVSSQRLTDRATALHRLSQSGAFLSTSEMVLFQMMKNTAHPAFKTISGFCKEERPDQLPSV